MFEADFIPILGQPQLDACSQVVSDPRKHLVFLFSLHGRDALSFSKDISQQVATWQLTSAEALHQHLLDLQQFCRQEKLSINYALLSLQTQQALFASAGGAVFIQRGQQFKQLMDNSAELKLLVGNLKENDQVFLSTAGENLLFYQLGQLLNQKDNSSQERLVSRLATYNNQHNQVDNALVLINIQPALTSNLPPQAKKLSWKNINLRQFFRHFLTGISVIWQALLSLPQRLRQLRQFLGRINWSKWSKIALPILVLLLLLSIFLFFQQRQVRQALANTQSQVETLQQQLEPLQNTVESQPLAARQKAQDVLAQLQALAASSRDRASQKLLATEIARVEALINDIAGQNNLDQLAVALNLQDYAQNFIGGSLELSNGNLYILENNRREILKINLQSKENQILSIPEGKEVRSFAVSEGQLYFLADGLWRLDVSNPNQYEQLKSEGDSDRGVTLMAAYGPYLYLVNVERRNIYRFYYNDGQLSEAIGWLTDKQGLNFADINDIKVDGDLWLAFRDGSLRRYNRGAATSFTLQGLPATLSAPLQIFTEENSDELAILAKEEKRLLIVNKNGEFISEISSNELAGASDLVFTPVDNKAYVLSGSVVYQLTF